MEEIVKTTPAGSEVVKESIVKKIPKGLNMKKNLTMIVLALVVVSAGIATGWFLSGKTKSQKASGDTNVPGKVETTKEQGISDESTFRDSAEGMLEAGGVNGEGTHHIVRDGGPSQYVYLTSTVVDLESFVGKKVMVWGETISAKKAGWLMDVGKIREAD